jgi:hypothetical protein
MTNSQPVSRYEVLFCTLPEFNEALASIHYSVTERYAVLKAITKYVIAEVRSRYVDVIAEDEPFVCAEAGFSVIRVYSERKEFFDHAYLEYRESLRDNSQVLYNFVSAIGHQLFEKYVPSIKKLVSYLPDLEVTESPPLRRGDWSKPAGGDMCEEKPNTIEQCELAADWAQRFVAGDNYVEELSPDAEQPFIAVLDTGVSFDFEPLQVSLKRVNRLINEHRFVDQYSLIRAGSLMGNRPTANLEHGTQVAWLIAGQQGYDAAKGSGVLPGYQLLPIRIADSTLSEAASLAEGICIALKAGANILVNTFTCSEESAALCASLRLMHKKYPDCVLVTSAGNCQMGTSLFPANYCKDSEYDNVISVGACYWDSSEAWFSNRPTAKTFLAPGYDVCVPKLVSKTDKFDTYAFDKPEGTSYSAPLAAAAIAKECVRSNVTPRQAVQILKQRYPEVGGVRVLGGLPLQPGC